jgi:ferredoxin
MLGVDDSHFFSIPEIEDIWTKNVQRSGFEPLLGGLNKQKAVYVDEVTCIGCKHCTHVAPSTFCLEDEYGRSRVFNQDGDFEESIQEAIDTCPVDCIHLVDFNQLATLENNRKNQVIRHLGLPQFHPEIKLD